MFKRLFGKKDPEGPAPRGEAAATPDAAPASPAADGSRAGVGKAHVLVTDDYLRENLEEAHVARARLVFQERERRYKEYRARKG